MSEDIEKLIVLNLKYASRERSLNKYVFADFSVKAMYQIMQARSEANKEKPIKLNELYKMLETLIGFTNLPRQIVKDSLLILKDDNKISGSHDHGWILHKTVYSEIERKLLLEDGFLQDVLNRHFPSDVDKEVLEKVFYEISSEVFGRFGDDVISGLSASTDNSFQKINLREIVLKICKKYKLKPKTGAFTESYESFISSTVADDLKLISDLAIRWFGTRLVVANVGHDPITVEGLTKAKFILDTNVLLSIALKRKPFSKSIEALGKSLNKIGAEMVYISSTKEEYQHTVTFRTQQVLEVLSNYDTEKIRELKIDDDFIDAGLAAKCKTFDEFKDYFDKIYDIPDRFPGGPKIHIDEDDKIEEVIDEASNDTALIKLIRTTKEELIPKESAPKAYSDKSIQHDASLIRVAEFLSDDEDREVWVLTLDNGLKYAGVKAAGSGTPSIMGIETLIEFIALSGFDESITNQDFAPLLATILKNHCLPYGGSHIRLSDLQNLQAAIKDAPNLPAENISRMANIVAKARFEHKSIESPEVQAKLVELQNKEFDKYDEKMKDLDTKRLDAERQTVQANSRADKADEKIEKLHKIAVSDKVKIIRFKVLLKTFLSIIWRTVVAGIFVFVVYLFSNHAWIGQASTITLMAEILAIIGLIAWVIKPIKDCVTDLKGAETVALKEIEE